MGYYALVLIYVDGILHIHHNNQDFMNNIREIYMLKYGVGEQNQYLGANIQKLQLEDGRINWSMTSEDYVTNAIKNLEETLEKFGVATLEIFGKKGVGRPFPIIYRPETDVSQLLNNELNSRYLQLIGITQWAVKLGCINMFTEVIVL